MKKNFVVGATIGGSVIVINYVLNFAGISMLEGFGVLGGVLAAGLGGIAAGAAKLI